MLARYLTREHARERLAWERERRLLVMTICHLSGKPLPVERDPEPYQDPHVDLGLIDDPSQLPDY